MASSLYGETLILLHAAAGLHFQAIVLTRSSAQITGPLRSSEPFCLQPRRDLVSGTSADALVTC